MTQERDLRRFLRGRRRVVESYAASWHGRGVFQERFRIRIDRYARRYELTAEVLELDEAGDWQPVRVTTRPLSPEEWAQVGGWIDAAVFWELPHRDQAPGVLDGDCWTIEGYRDGRYHEVYRHTGSVLDGTGAAVYELGRRLARLAGLDHAAESPTV
jgi:hypothetical protein